jgi:hypothetical protein
MKTDKVQVHENDGARLKFRSVRIEGRSEKLNEGNLETKEIKPTKRTN